MKINPKYLLALLLFQLGVAVSSAQEDLLSVVKEEISEPTPADISEVPTLPERSDLENELPEIGADPADLPPVNPEPPDNAAGSAPFGPLEDQKREMEETSEGYIIKDAGLNDIFQFLAKSAGRQYFHNLKINGPDYMVTGHLDDGNPLNQMEELAFMYGLSLHTKGNTIYALTQAQLSQLPSAEYHYQLQYLRPSDIEQIKELIKPMLTPGTGIVNFEPKTNTVIIIDTATRIEAAQNLLHGIDKAKGQIIVETKILRINSTSGEKMGVNWSQNLGDAGVSLGVTTQLADIFGLPAPVGSDVFGGLGTESIVLAPAQLTGLLRALDEGGISNQVSNPTLITEDNEQATISIIDRIPIITSTSTPSTTGQLTVTEEVRYKIDTSDKAITEDPDNHREIGISIAVTPTLLPDGTVRMKMRPRSAQITGEVVGVSLNGGVGNRYPRVTESMVETLARIPDGNSLVVGGFYGEVQSKDKTKVPLLGDIPMLNFFFKSKEASKEQTSLVFIVTPTSYDPADVSANSRTSNLVKGKTVLPCDYDHIDPYNPGPAHEPNLKRTIRGMKPAEAPYYPREDEFQSAPTREPVEAAERTKPKFSRARRR
ncbi:type II secretion system protein GspD [Luteolibacter algae]|uniref:Type II secretion system protein GspD n=1 Tax=Luteolibacter algae TaxID=454151 RepID=A0ABW5DEH6_9BACT